MRQVEVPPWHCVTRPGGTGLQSHNPNLLKVEAVESEKFKVLPGCFKFKDRIGDTLSEKKRGGRGQRSELLFYIRKI